MPGDEEKRPPPPSFPRNPRHSRKPHVIPADAGTKRKQSTPLTPFAKQRGTRAQRAGGQGEARTPPSFPRTPPSHSRARPFVIPASPVIPADAGTQKNKARLFSRSEGARERSDSRGCPVPTRRGQPSSDEAHESKPPPPPYPGVSPIQTSPPSKYSFFQIGTTSFNRSMKYNADSKAGRRCAALTANTMLVSPMSTRPVR